MANVPGPLGTPQNIYYGVVDGDKVHLESSTGMMEWSVQSAGGQYFLKVNAESARTPSFRVSVDGVDRGILVPVPAETFITVPGTAANVNLTGISGSSVALNATGGVVAWKIKDYALPSPDPVATVAAEGGWNTIAPALSWSASGLSHVAGGMGTRFCYLYVKDANGKVAVSRADAVVIQATPGIAYVWGAAVTGEANVYNIDMPAPYDDMPCAIKPGDIIIGLTAGGGGGGLYGFERIVYCWTQEYYSGQLGKIPPQTEKSVWWKRATGTEDVHDWDHMGNDMLNQGIRFPAVFVFRGCVATGNPIEAAGGLTDTTVNESQSINGFTPGEAGGLSTVTPGACVVALEMADAYDDGTSQFATLGTVSFDGGLPLTEPFTRASGGGLTYPYIDLIIQRCLYAIKASPGPTGTLRSTTVWDRGPYQFADSSYILFSLALKPQT